jgi:hypothetical protein
MCELRLCLDAFEDIRDSAGRFEYVAGAVKRLHLSDEASHAIFEPSDDMCKRILDGVGDTPKITSRNLFLYLFIYFYKESIPSSSLSKN